MKRKHTRLWRIWVGILAAWLIGGAVSAREWSDEMQLTHLAEDGFNMGTSLLIEKDPNNNIYFACQAWEVEVGEDDEFVFCRKFNRFGESLSDRISIKDAFEFHDSLRIGLTLLDTYLDSENSLLYLLLRSSHNEVMRYFTVTLDEECNPVDNILTFRELAIIPPVGNHPLTIIKNSINQIVIGGSSHTYWNDDSVQTTRVFYRKYTLDGNSISGFQFINHNPHRHADGVYLRMDEADILYFMWREMIGGVNRIRFSKIGPNDSALIDDFEITAHDEWRQTGFDDFELDERGNIVVMLRFTDLNGLGFIRKYDSNMNELFQTSIGRMGGSGSRFGWFDLFVDINNNIHSSCAYHPEGGSQYLGYTQLSLEGDTIDSADVVYSREERPRGWWDFVQVFAFNDGFTGIIWQDSRFGNDQREAFYSFSGLNNIDNDSDEFTVCKKTTIIANFPDPFNNATHFYFNIPPTGNAALNIYDLNGKIVFKDCLTYKIGGGLRRYTWYGKGINGAYLPSGSYWLKLKTTTGSSIESVKIVR